jgi:chromate transport protein ChrA
MSKVCSIVFGVLVAAYAIALGLLLIGTYGLFGQEKDPLSGAFLLMLGLPWNMLIDPLPESVKPWVVGLTPALNLLIVRTICRWATSSAR